MDSPNLLLNIIPFDIPIKEIKCSFFENPRDGFYQIQNLELLNKANAQTKKQTYYTDFQFDPSAKLSQTFQIGKSIKISKHYCKYLIFNYFQDIGEIVRFNGLGEPELWFKSKEQPNPLFELYYKISIRVQYNRITKGFELLIYYKGQLAISTRSIDKLEDISTALYNLVLFQRKIYKYNQLPDDAFYDQSEIFPHLNGKVREATGFEKVKLKEFRYPRIFEILTDFYNHYLNVPEFKKVIQTSEKGFHKIEPERIFKTSHPSNFLLFGRNTKGTNPNIDLPKLGPYKLPKDPDKQAIHFILIVHDNQVDKALEFRQYVKGEKEGSKGLKEYIKVPFTIEKEFKITFTNADNPFPEIKKQLINYPWNSNITYFAFYLSPISKDNQCPEKLKVYFKVKEQLLKYHVASQVIDCYKIGTENYHKSIANISVAVLAKLKGVPWRLERKLKDELIVGVGAFKSKEIGVRFIGCGFSFTNDGTFNEFGCYSESESFLLKGHIEKSIQNYKKEKGEIARIIIHYYKTENKKEQRFMDDLIFNLGLNIPIFIVSINKTEFEDYLLFDPSFPELIPYSGTIIDIGRNEFLLCNNTRHPIQEDTAIDSNQMPLKLKLNSTHPELLTNEMILDLIDQVYQFGHMNWKSLKHQRLPVTVTYPEMVAQMLPYFDRAFLPPFGKKSLWFL